MLSAPTCEAAHDDRVGQRGHGWVLGRLVVARRDALGQAASAIWCHQIQLWRNSSSRLGLGLGFRLVWWQGSILLFCCILVPRVHQNLCRGLGVRSRVVCSGARMILLRRMLHAAWRDAALGLA